MDFYNKYDKHFKSSLFSVQEDSETQFEKMFDYVEHETGYTIDIYKKIVFYENHLKAMIGYINRLHNQNEKLSEFKIFVETILLSEKCIVFIGN